MEDRQLVLFFKNSFDVDDLSTLLVSKFNYLGDVLVIPKNENDVPLIIFQKNEIKLTISNNIVDFKYFKGNDFDSILNIIECLKNEGFTFDRMGYISFYDYDEKAKEKYISNTFKKIDNNKDFQLSTYKIDLIDSVRVNVVEIEKTIDNNLSIVFDINTPLNESYYITSSFLSDFLKECDIYIKRVISNNIE